MTVSVSIREKEMDRSNASGDGERKGVTKIESERIEWRACQMVCNGNDIYDQNAK